MAGPRSDLFSTLQELLDVFVVIALGLYLYYAQDKERLGEIVWAVGAIVVVHRILVSRVLKESINPISNKIKKISEIVDLSQGEAIDELRNLQKLYLGITEPEFQKVKDAIIENATNRLQKLTYDKHSDELPTSEYYSWLLPILDSIDDGQTIKAVSLMFDTEWDDSPAEKQFIEKNLSAAARGVRVERIFIMEKSFLEKAFKLEPVQYHVSEKIPNLQGYFVDRERLEREERSLLESVGDGFICFDSGVALVDKFGETGEVRGVVTMNPVEIRQLDKTFERLKVYGIPLSQSLIEQSVGNMPS